MLAPSAATDFVDTDSTAEGSHPNSSRSDAATSTARSAATARALALSPGSSNYHPAAAAAVRGAVARLAL